MLPPHGVWVTEATTVTAFSRNKMGLSVLVSVAGARRKVEIFEFVHRFVIFH